MAQVVGYMDNHVEFKEGPFVICNALGNGWRIEVELKGHICPVLPDASIYELIKRLRMYPGKFVEKAKAEKLCNLLNRLVKHGGIRLKNNQWVAN